MDRSNSVGIAWNLPQSTQFSVSAKAFAKPLAACKAKALHKSSLDILWRFRRAKNQITMHFALYLRKLCPHIWFPLDSLKSTVCRELLQERSTEHACPKSTSKKIEYARFNRHEAQMNGESAMRSLAQLISLAKSRSMMIFLWRSAAIHSLPSARSANSVRILRPSA